MFSLVCKRREIFAHWNLFEKSMGKQRGFFYHQNYNEKSRWKQRGFFDQRNYVERSTWEQRGFFDHRNCVEKSTLKQRGFFDNRNITSKKYVEITWILRSAKLHQKSTWKWRRNLSKFGLRCIDVISTLNRHRFNVVCPLEWLKY